MASLFDLLSTQLGEAWRPRRRPTAHRAYRCLCERPVFFRNSECLACHTPLGYEPQRALVVPLRADPGDDTLWETATGAPGHFRRCANFHLAAGCNWLVAAEDPAPLCVACRLNRTIPDLDREDNAQLWQRIEVAKRRLVSSLVALRLPVRSRVSEDPDRGLAFDFLRAAPDGPPVLTGHAQGIITLNVEEADDAYRERVRTAMREPYRTLLGHFRHEVGHYYWDRLVAGTAWLEDFRELFGDERSDYAAALQRHYEEGPAPDWAHHHVSAYASTHPWEDWAETWAHYLHMVDTLDTALSFGLEADDLEISYEPFGPDSLFRPDDSGAARFLSFVNAWTELTGVLNELSRSMGQHDFYPFVLPREAVGKLQFVHLVVSDAASSATAPTSVSSAR